MPAGVDLLAVGNLAAEDGEADRAEPGRVGDGRHPAHLAVVGGDRRAGLGRIAREGEPAQAAVGVPAIIVQPGDRLLPGIAPLRKSSRPARRGRPRPASCRGRTRARTGGCPPRSARPPSCPSRSPPLPPRRKAPPQKRFSVKRAERQHAAWQKNKSVAAKSQEANHGGHGGAQRDLDYVAPGVSPGEQPLVGKSATFSRSKQRPTKGSGLHKHKRPNSVAGLRRDMPRLYTRDFRVDQRARSSALAEKVLIV